MRYAILDTDFVSKAHIIKVNDHVFADEVLAFPDYNYFCHAKMAEELAAHGSVSANKWLEQKFNFGEIICYDDRRILSELNGAVGKSRFYYYCSFLKAGCDLFRSDYYASYFGSLEKRINEKSLDEDSFLAELGSCEAKIGHKNNYGEIKAFVLTKMFQLLNGDIVTVFCSDDFNARRSISNAAVVPCISILGAFYKFYLLSKPYDEICPFYQSYVDWLADPCMHEPQDKVRVWMHVKGTLNREQVPIKDVLTDIYSGKYEIRKDGDLQMK